MYTSAKEILPGVFNVIWDHPEFGEITTTVTADDPDTAELRASLYDGENLKEDVVRYSATAHLPVRKAEAEDELKAEKENRLDALFGGKTVNEVLADIVTMAAAETRTDLEAKAATIASVKTWYTKHTGKLAKCRSIAKVDQCVTEAIEDA